MFLSISASILSRWAAFQELSAALADGVLCVEADGLWGSSRALVQAAVMRDTGRPLLSLSPRRADGSRGSYR